MVGMMGDVGCTAKRRGAALERHIIVVFSSDLGWRASSAQRPPAGGLKRPTEKMWS